jgi:predicted aspartyl protease
MSVIASSSHFPYLPVHLKIVVSQNELSELDLEALVDTGFDGNLAMAKNLIPEFAEPISQSIWTLADETDVVVFAYAAYITIGKSKPILTSIIGLGEEAILGRGITDRYKLILDHGSKIIVEP